MRQSISTFIRHVILLAALCVSSATMHAHQPDISSTVLIEREDSSMILHIRASLTAFQYAIQGQYGDSAYASPEEFRELVFEHVKANLSVVFNQNDTATIENIHVKLGHETSVLFGIKGIPDEVSSIAVKNSSFRTIQRNQSALVVLKEGFSREQIVLNDNNEHTVRRIALREATASIDADSLVIPGYIYTIGGVLLLALGGVFLIKKKKLVGG